MGFGTWRLGSCWRAGNISVVIEPQCPQKKIPVVPHSHLKSLLNPQPDSKKHITNVRVESCFNACWDGVFELPGYVKLYIFLKKTFINNTLKHFSLNFSFNSRMDGQQWKILPGCWLLSALWVYLCPDQRDSGTKCCSGQFPGSEWSQRPCLESIPQSLP